MTGGVRKEGDIQRGEARQGMHVPQLGSEDR